MGLKQDTEPLLAAPGWPCCQTAGVKQTLSGSPAAGKFRVLSLLEGQQ